MVSVKVSAERKAPLFFLEASPLVTSTDTEASTHKRENKPLVPWVVTDKLANHFASFSYQISEELRQILTSVPRARTNEGLKKVKTPVKNSVVLIAITT